MPDQLPHPAPRRRDDVGGLPVRRLLGRHPRAARAGGRRRALRQRPRVGAQPLDPRPQHGRHDARPRRARRSPRPSADRPPASAHASLGSPRDAGGAAPLRRLTPHTRRRPHPTCVRATLRRPPARGARTRGPPGSGRVDAGDVGHRRGRRRRCGRRHRRVRRRRRRRPRRCGSGSACAWPRRASPRARCRRSPAASARCSRPGRRPPPTARSSSPRCARSARGPSPPATPDPVARAACRGRAPARSSRSARPSGHAASTGRSPVRRRRRPG